MFLPHPRVKVSIVGNLRDRDVACSASDRQDSNFESCVWRKVSSQSSHHPQEVLLAQFSLYVHKGGLKPDSFHFIYNSWAKLNQNCLHLPKMTMETTDKGAEDENYKRMVYLTLQRRHGRIWKERHNQSSIRHNDNVQIMSTNEFGGTHQWQKDWLLVLHSATLTIPHDEWLFLTRNEDMPLVYCLGYGELYRYPVENLYNSEIFEYKPWRQEDFFDSKSS